MSVHTPMRSSSAMLVDLLRAMDGQFAVTISYTKRSGNQSIRTVDIYDAVTTAEGNILIEAIERFAGGFKSFRLERITSCVLHPGLPFPLVTPPVELSVRRPFLRSAAQLIALELGRDDWNTKPKAPVV